MYQVWMRQAYSALPYWARQGCEHATEHNTKPKKKKRDMLSLNKKALSITRVGQG